MQNNMYPKLGKNIRALRKAFGKSLNQMADDLATAGNSEDRFNDEYRFIQKSTISYYENGKRIPEREKLSVIAKYFKVTEDELLYGDFTKLKFNTNTLNKDTNNKYLNSLFPLISTKEALNNKKFKEAYSLHKNIHDNIINETSNFEESDIERFKQLYEEAYKENKVIESIYNLLSWIMLEDCMCSILNPTISEKIDIDENITASELIEMIYLSKPELDQEEVLENEKFKKELKEYIEKQERIFFKYITILKNNNIYTDFADFYIALRYMFGLLSDNNYETNRLIGKSLMNTFDYIGNEYVRKFKLINKSKK